MNSHVRDLVWSWLDSEGREVVAFSDLTKGLCGPQRRISSLTPTPRDAIRDALALLAHDGLVSLSPTPNRLGRPGVLITIRKDH